MEKLVAALRLLCTYILHKAIQRMRRTQLPVLKLYGMVESLGTSSYNFIHTCAPLSASLYVFMVLLMQDHNLQDSPIAVVTKKLYPQSGRQGR